MGKQTTPQQLGKFLCYVLGRHPDEFGLVPDPQGFVPIMDLLKVCAEEADWRHVRRAPIEALRLVLPDCPIEINGEQIRAADRTHLPCRLPAAHPPPLLYIAVRRRAHGTALERGLTSPHAGSVVLADQTELALRMGRRRDHHPVMLTVHLSRYPQGLPGFEQFGDHIYLCPDLPASCITGPPPPPAHAEPAVKKKPVAAVQPKTPGSFILDPTRSPVPPSQGQHGKKGGRKPKRQPPPWRS
ncbi:MAG: hypothetical protein JEZ11_10910 [Desulfobacterales bacterium]|nr:hypothetical protein [Desulfobacterales bacterium]